jgi:hypothetical protein
MSDIEGKVAREAMSECGQRASLKAFGVGFWDYLFAIGTSRAGGWRRGRSTRCNNAASAPILSIELRTRVGIAERFAEPILLCNRIAARIQSIFMKSECRRKHYKNVIQILIDLFPEAG